MNGVMDSQGSTPFSLGGRVVLVTGASGAIGAAVARACAAAGARVLLSGRNRERLEAIREACGGETLAADLRDPAAVEALAGGIPVLKGWVHCAGEARQRLVRQETPTGLRQQMEVNFETAAGLAQALWKAGRFGEGCSTVLVSSIAGRSGAAAHGAYAASKAALLGWVRCAAVEGRRMRLRFNVLSPGMVRSRMADEAAAALSPEALAAHEAEYPLGFGEPADVAGPAVFLLSDAARWITGTELVVDGGFTCR